MCVFADFLITPMSRLKHTLNSVFVVCDLLIQAVPIRIFHLVYPLLFGGVYSLFNAVYFIHGLPGPGGRHYAYGVMDWRNPMESSITCALAFMLSTLNQCVLYEIYALRVWIYNRFSRHPPGVAASVVEQNQKREERVNILQKQNGEASGLQDYHTVHPEAIEMDKNGPIDNS